MKLSLLLFSLVFLFPLTAEETLQARLDTAYEWYRKGESAETSAARKEAFNQALVGYSSLEQAYPKGELYFNIGNSYYQLGEYSWAVLYYLRAQQQLPRDAKVEQHLSQALQKLALPASSGRFALLSTEEMWLLFFILTLAGIALWSLLIWRDRPWLKKVTIATGIASFCVLGSLFFSSYFSPLKAVVVNSTPLYRDAGSMYTPVSLKPLSAGLTVHVLEIIDEGRWLKISNPEGAIGYVPQPAIRLIN